MFRSLHKYFHFPAVTTSLLSNFKRPSDYFSKNPLTIMDIVLTASPFPRGYSVAHSILVGRHWRSTRLTHTRRASAASFSLSGVSLEGWGYYGVARAASRGGVTSLLSKVEWGGVSYIVYPRPPRRSVSDGGGGGDFRFLATTENVTLKLTLDNLKPHIFTGCHGTQHARRGSGHPRSSWKTAGQEEVLFLRVWFGPRHRLHDYYFWVHDWTIEPPDQRLNLVFVL